MPRTHEDKFRVTLTSSEFAMASHIGCLRNLSAVQANRRIQHGIDPDDVWRAHIEGACGELALAKFLGWHWGGDVDTFRSRPDLGNIEIRTRSKHYYDLIVREDDDPNNVFVLVTGIAPNYWIRGWILGKDARRDEWKHDHAGRPEAWFVPSKALKPFKKGA